MIEAQIECLCKRFPLHDFGLHLRQGQVEWVDEAKAKASKELTDAHRVGAVRVRFLTRTRMAKPPKAPKLPAPPNVRLGRNRVRRLPPVKKPTPVPTPAPAVLSKEDMAEIYRQEVRASLRAQAAQPAAPVLDVKGQVAEALAEVLGNLPQRSTAPVATAPTDEDDDDGDPLYIPSNLLDKDTKADITVKAASSDAAGLDEAAKALKAAKKGSVRKPRKKKQTKPEK